MNAVVDRSNDSIEQMGQHEIVDQLKALRTIRERTDAEAPEIDAMHQEAADQGVDPYPDAQPWYLDDFQFRYGQNGQRFLTPKREFVDALIQSAPIRMTRAYDSLSAADRGYAETVALEFKDAIEMLYSIDTFQAQLLEKYFAQQAARQAARAASIRHSAVKWKARLRPGQEEPEKLTHMIGLVAATARVGALMLHMARVLSPDVKVDYRQACWETARINAYNIQQRVLDPKANSDHEQSASSALLDAC